MIFNNLKNSFVAATAFLVLAGTAVSALAAPVKIHGQQVQVSASVGVHLAATGETAADALHAADLAMYKVKGARNRKQSLVP